jgi:hypothetical protein
MVKPNVASLTKAVLQNATAPGEQHVWPLCQFADAATLVKCICAIVWDDGNRIDIQRAEALVKRVLDCDNADIVHIGHLRQVLTQIVGASNSFSDPVWGMLDTSVAKKLRCPTTGAAEYKQADNKDKQTDKHGINNQTAEQP